MLTPTEKVILQLQQTPSQVICMEQLGFSRRVPFQRPVEITFDDFLNEVPIQSRILFFVQLKLAYATHLFQTDVLECVPLRMLEARWHRLERVLLVIEDRYTEFIPK